MTNKRQSPALTYLAAIRKRVAAIRKDIPALITLSERMARPLLAGGNMFPPRIASWWPEEFSNRAGGLMGLKRSFYEAESSKDVAFFALPNSRTWDPRKDEALAKLMKGPAQLFVVGRKEDLAPLGNLRRFAGFTGGADPREGFGASGSFKPLAPLAPFDQFVRGWITTGELVGACTRAGRMPILWMSVWLEGAPVRDAHFLKHNNLREPWFVPFFHADRYIPPLARGYAANAFLSELERILTVIEAQQAQLAKAGRWMAEAKKNGKRVHTVLVGHSYPEILERPKNSDYPIEWGQSLSDLSKAVPADFGRGDVAIHLGYSPVNVENVQNILKRGIRFIYTSPFGRPKTLKNHPNLIWLDSPWRPTDQSIDIPAYSVRMLPMSSSVGTCVYFALLCEMAARMGWMA